MKKWKKETRLCHDDSTYFDHHGAIVPPIYQNSLFAFQSWEEIDSAFDNMSSSYIYSRLKNPSVNLVEQKISELCGGESAKLCASGMGAISAAILSYLETGDHIVTIKNVYGPANNFMGQFLREKSGINVSYVDGSDTKAWSNAINPNTKLFYLESPASMTFDLQDIRSLTALAKRRGIKTIIDNTWASPIFQQPLKMGVDMEVHSVSKYIGGHSDIVAGVIVGSKIDLDAILVSEHALLGAKMAPFEAWLVLRSLRTLSIRMKKHQENALDISNFLYQHPAVKEVNFPGLPTSPFYDLGKAQMSGYSGLMSFELATDQVEKIKTFVDTLQLFKIGVSWGGHESLVYAPTISYAKELSPEKFKALNMSIGLIRLSLGLENASDLIEDLQTALSKI